MNTRFSKALLAILGSGLFLTGCSDDTGAENGGQGMPAGVIPSVEVIQARLGALPLEERMSGIVHAKNQVTLYAEVSAPIVEVAAQNGDYVEQGQALVRLRDKQYQDQIRQAEAALQISQADAKRTAATLDEQQARLVRMEHLVSRQLESAQQLETLKAQVAGADAAHDQAVARIAQSEANLEEQRELLRRTVVRAPVSGFVGQRNAEVGMRADAGTPLFIIGDFSTVRVKVALTDRMVSRIKVGHTALIRPDSPDAPIIQAEVSRISPFIEAGSYTAEAEIDVPNESNALRPGMFVTVDVLYGQSEQAILVPESVLYEDPNTGILGVYVAPSLRTETPIQEPDEYDEANPPPLTEPTQMIFRSVEVEARGRGVAGISGLQMGDWVVTVGQNMIRPIDGQAQARARPTSWDRIASMQRLQDQDLLRQFMDKQQRMADEAFPVSAAAQAEQETPGGTP